ncbi:hypothetical protein [Roseovarius phycicola]|uniref:Flagellar FliJ protein n=1 Tax=Roseovarius phycicola TaxID=3080976 RepID=A0ABZ2HKD1_9RHOB
MKKDVHRELLRLTEAKYEADLSNLRALREAEARVQQALRDMDDVHKRNAAALRCETSGQKSLGGDVLWQAWMSRARIAKQMEIAQMRVQKEHLMQKLRMSFGRKEAVRALQEYQSQSIRKQINKRYQSDQECLGVLNTAYRSKHQ